MNGELNKQNVERFLTYDRNGNLLTLIRYADGVQSSNRQYTYIGNRLDRMEKDKVIAWDEIEVHPGGPAIVVPEKVTEDNGTAALDAGISMTRVRSYVLSTRGLSCIHVMRTTATAI